MSPPLRLLQPALAVSLLVSAALALLWTIHWPLVGDTALMHYIVFLTEHGMVPYRVLGDMNMPGSFLVEMAAMRLFGDGALAWRLFDFSLLAAAAWAFFAVTGPGNRLAALFAASLFALVHTRDGLAEGGQRDLTMAVALVGATAFLSVALRGRTLWPVAAFGLLSGLAFTIKPTALPLSLAQLGIALWILRRRGHSGRPPFVAALLAMTLFPLLALAFLLNQRALGAFLESLRTVVPFYAGLGHRPLGYLLLHSLSPLLSLVLPWLAVLALQRFPSRRGVPSPLVVLPQGNPRLLPPERLLLASGVLFGLLSYLVQARGLPYYRYPLLAFLLPLIALDLTQALPLLREPSTRNGLAAILALAGLCIGGFVLAPQSAWLIHRDRWWDTQFIASLEANLNRLGGPKLSGHVQCIDTISGCGATLYRMRLVSATGVLSDFLLFGPENEAAVRQTRATLRAALQTAPPRVIVVSSYLYLGGSDHFEKLARWPEFAALLARDYRLDTAWSPNHKERWWSREEYPAGYRIYVLR